jgi:hypothetical protein
MGSSRDSIPSAPHDFGAPALGPAAANLRIPRSFLALTRPLPAGSLVHVQHHSLPTQALSGATELPRRLPRPVAEQWSGDRHLAATNTGSTLGAMLRNWGKLDGWPDPPSS